MNSCPLVDVKFENYVHIEVYCELNNPEVICSHTTSMKMVMPDIVLEPMKYSIFNSGLEFFKMPSRANVEVSVPITVLNVFLSMSTLNLIEWNAE